MRDTEAIKILRKSLRGFESERDAKIEAIRRLYEPTVNPLNAEIIRQKKLANSR